MSAQSVAFRQIYGYDLVKRLSAVPAWVVTEGTIYPLLSRLRKTGLVDSRLVESESGPARRYYLLTAQGRRQLAAMNAYWGGLVQGIASLLKGEG